MSQRASCLAEMIVMAGFGEPVGRNRYVHLKAPRGHKA